ncbi:hypothetical protein BD626DRAFT_568655 [Schizophyllum amplum]|uniref:F-box domain-containing protein n=1 Tax=Schizophyllum amplum TaxID=97359 RepID=A0A550CH01_9AGAR|nr:hypothetical protein BD626DRAFT_568655 [Auriculariopsis ampla]
MTLDDHSYPSLPSELIDAVVDELIVDKDIPSLQKFALSHRSVVPKIQKFLFSDIELGMLQTHAVNEGQLPLAPAQKLYDAFQATPHLAEYVDTLALVIVNPSASADDNGESVARILPLLQNVRSLSIESRCSGRVLPDAVAKALALPSVTELRTSWVQLWLSLPSAFPSLRSLFCDNTEWIAILGFPNTIRMLQLCQETLQHLEACPPSRCPVIAALRYNLALHTRLRCLVIHRMVFYSPAFWMWLLETLSSVQYLHTLCIDFLVLNLTESDINKIVDSDKPMWNQLDEVLGSSHGRFEQVDICIRPQSGKLHGCAEARKLLGTLLTCTNESSSLSINIDEEATSPDLDYDPKFTME